MSSQPRDQFRHPRDLSAPADAARHAPMDGPGVQQVDGFVAGAGGLFPGLSGCSRRGFLLAGLAVLAGCNATRQIADLPEPEWPTGTEPPPAALPPRMPIPPSANPQPLPPATPGMPNVVSRASWSHGAPDYSDMNRMLPITHVTVHHDALTPFIATDAASAEARIELIRVSHRNKGWADIGYHFVIDRSGRVYEARPLAWQGAHVKDRNEGNIGILCLGNFEVQSPSEQQLNALVAHVKTLRQRYRVPTNRVVTHREWPGAQTLCPGANLQARVNKLRSNKAFA